MKMEKVSFKATFTHMQELSIGGSDFRKILGVLSVPNVMKSLLRTFSNHKTIFSKQYYLIYVIQIVLFQVREGSVDAVEALWLLLKEFEGLL